MADDNSIIIACRYTGTELLTVCRLKVLLRCRKDICSGIQTQEITRPLLRQMVWYYKQRLLSKPKPFKFHSCRSHFKGLAGPYAMGKERIISIQHMGYRIFLMRLKLYIRCHARKLQM